MDKRQIYDGKKYTKTPHEKGKCKFFTLKKNNNKEEPSRRGHIFCTFANRFMTKENKT